MAFTLNVGNLSVPQGAYRVLTASDVSITDGVPEDFYLVSTLPTVGRLLKNRVPMAVGDSFTQTDVANGSIAYDNNGVDATNDSFGLQARDTTADATVAQVTSTVTVTANGGWIVAVLPAQFTFAIPLRTAKQLTALSYSEDWLVHNVGVADVLALSTAGNVDLRPYLELNQIRDGAHLHNFDDRDVFEVDRAANMLYEELQNNGDYSAVAALITSRGEWAIEEAAGTVKRDLEALKRRYAIDNLHFERRIVDPWYSVVQKVSVRLNL